MKHCHIEKEIVQRINQAPRICVLTGAGISAASGVPTFRGKNGLWRNYRPEDLATPQAFHRDPALVWEWYLWRRTLIRKVEPNPAHHALVTLETMKSDFTLITQNVDNLHFLAGNKNVIELHGNIMRSKCIQCDAGYLEDVEISTGIPRCPECDGYIRPDVVWFGESLPVEAIEGARRASMSSTVFLVIGTSGVVEPAASLPRLARVNDSFVIEINTEETPLTSFCDTFFQAAADTFLPELIRTLQE